MREFHTTIGAHEGTSDRRRARAASRVVIVAGLACLSGLAGCELGPAATATRPLPTPTATIMPIPTYTPLPPTPTPTSRELVIAAVAEQDVGGLGYDATASYDAGTHDVAVVIMIVVPGVPNNPTDVDAAHEQAKTICLRAQHTLWTNDLTRSLALRQVSVTVVGPILAQYADLETAAYAAAVLSAPVESRFVWNALTPDAAWSLYDNVYLRPDFNDAS